VIVITGCRLLKINEIFSVSGAFVLNYSFVASKVFPLFG
jgi:hypothetical protein